MYGSTAPADVAVAGGLSMTEIQAGLAFRSAGIHIVSDICRVYATVPTTYVSPTAE